MEAIKKGQTVDLDKGYLNQSVVKVVRVDSLFCTVKSLQTGEEWDVMKHRLTQIEKNENI